MGVLVVDGAAPARPQYRQIDNQPRLDTGTPASAGFFVRAVIFITKGIDPWNYIT